VLALASLEGPEKQTGAEKSAPVVFFAALLSAIVAQATPQCDVPNKDITIVRYVGAEYPDSARDLGLGPVTVYVRVTIGTDGRVEAASIYKSSQNMAIDRAAIRAAQQTIYSPKIVGCLPVVSDGIIREDPGTANGPGQTCAAQANLGDLAPIQIPCMPPHPRRT
jgi:TonB family protein